MHDYKAVYSSLELSKRIVSWLQMADPAALKPENRAQNIRQVNDILQGRGEMSVDMLFADLTQVFPPRCDAQFYKLWQGVRDFLHQKELLSHTYNKSGNQVYSYKMDKGPWNMKLKIIDQDLYDRAAREGFPPDFFRDSYFKKVTFYCLPEHADFYGSIFQDCTFAVCRIDNASFVHVSMYSGHFHSSVLRHVNFSKASLIYTHFHDSTLDHASFQRTNFGACNFIDCALNQINFCDALLDGCFFGRVTASEISGLQSARITQGGATEEECRLNRTSIFQALGVKQEGI